MKKLKLGRYPYTYVRATVMRSMLLKKEDYHKLLKMSHSSITNFLQESVYRKEIDKLATEFSGAELIEIALNENLVASFNKLRSISPDELKILIDLYSKRKDIENVKTVLRAKYVKADEKELKKLIQAAGTLNAKFFLELFKLSAIEDILKRIKIVPFRHLEKAYEKFQKENSLMEIETALDQFYYEEVIQTASLLPKQGRMFKEFLMNEVDIKNIMTILRLTREKTDKGEIKGYLIKGEGLRNNWMLELLKSNNLEDLIEKLGKSKYKDAIMGGAEKLKKENTLIDIEIGLYNQLLKKSILLLHQHPLSVDVILGYMFAKEIEIRNLNLITKGKQLVLSEEFIEKQLVVG